MRFVYQSKVRVPVPEIHMGSEKVKVIVAGNTFGGGVVLVLTWVILVVLAWH